VLKLSADKKARIFNLPLINLYEKKPVYDALILIEESLASKLRLIPFDLDNSQIKVAVENPENQEVLDILTGLKEKLKKEIKVFVAFPEQINYGLEWYKDNDLSENQEKYQEKVLKNKAKEAEQNLKVNIPETQLPVFDSAENLIDHAISFKASKIHFDCTPEGAKIYYHIQKLHAISKLSSQQGSKIVTEIKKMAHLEEGHVHRHGDFSLVDGQKFFRFLVTSFPLPVGEKINIEIDEIDQQRYTLKSLGISLQQQEEILSETRNDSGIYFVVGPEGSGRTTTMYALLRLFKEKNKRILTLEKPVDCYFKGVDQVEVEPLKGLTFSLAFKKLFHNYDVILIEGIRDSQTLDLVFEASLKGKIIIAPLNLKDSLAVFNHLEQMGIEKEKILNNVKVIINQRLVLRLCANCRIKTDLSDSETEEISIELAKNPTLNKMIAKKFEPHQCHNCDQTGFFGHLGIFEVITKNHDFKELIRYNQANKQEGYFNKKNIITLYQDGLLKVTEGLTTLEEVKRVTGK